MKTLDANMKDMFNKQLPILATVTGGLTPNIGPKRSLRVYTEDSLIFNENTGGQTLANIQNGSNVVVAIIDREALDGYRFLGTAEIFAEGTPAFDNCVEFASKNNMKTPKYAVVIKIEEIYTLKSGPTAGMKL